MRALLNLLFPSSCLACMQVESGLRFFCSACDTSVEPVAPGCTRCGEPGELALCPRCVKNPPPFREARAAFVHGGAVARAIHAFKYEDRPELAEGLASLLIETAGTFLATSPQYMCALPLHRGRFLRRRYDQAQLLARAVARQLGRQFASDFLRRTRDTPRQVDLNESQREENVAGAFEGLPAARGHSILLVDDVLTTGATARAASQALLDAGAAWVQVLTLARA